MRIALCLHAFPPQSRTGVETYTEALARALAGRGHDLHIFAPRRDDSREHLSQTSEEQKHYKITWLALGRDPDTGAERRARHGAAAAFGRFLDREQPQVVHFQHILKLGWELIDEARERGLVTVYSAHDPFPVTNDYTLLSADLSPLDPGDLVAAARNERALGLLDRAFEAHDGFLPPGCGDQALRREVERVLHGEVPGEKDRDDLTQAMARLALELDERRAAVSRCDRVEAPTAFLADLLGAQGLRAPVACRPCGHDVEHLSEVVAVDGQHQGPLRVLFLGGLFEHKGAHILLDALPLCAGQGAAGVALTLRGSRGSSDYGAHLASRAADLGATLGGPYERHELPALLAAADLVALPSIWPENAPFVIREAFAAGRPVIASDTPALRESVRDGVDGRLVDLGDAAAWAACLCELARDRDELAELCRGVRPPKTTAEDARELEQIYTDLAEHHSARRTRARARQPAHLAAFSQALEALEALPTGELVERALAGLAQLASRLGQQPMGLTQALVSAEGLRERLAARERTADWRAETERHGRAARADLRAGLADREQALSALEARQGQLSRELESVAGERDWLRRSSVDLQAELAWTGESLDDRRAHLTEAQARLRSADDGLQAALAERDDLCSALAQRESELRALRLDHAKRDESSSAHDELRRAYEPLCAAHEALGAAYNSLRGAHEALQLHESWLRGELLRVFEVVQNEDSGDCEASDEIESLVAQAFEGLQRWSTELDWRAGEMAAATEESQGLGARLLPSALQRRADSWRKPSRPSGEAPS